MGMAQPLTRRDERRETILDIAREAFLADGYAATSMSSIAARLGGSKGTLYNYFKSKEELFAAVMERQCAALSQALFDGVERGGDVRQQLSQFARGLLQTLLSDDGMGIHRLVVAEAGRFPELGRAFFEAGPRRVGARIAAYLADLMEQGVLRRADPDLASQHLKDLALSGLYYHRLWSVIDHPTPEQVERQIDEAVDTFLRAYRPD